MDKSLAKLITGMIPVKKWRKDARSYLLGHPEQVHPAYGRIYSPIYNMHARISSLPEGMPEIFDRDGRRMEMFFVRDLHSAHFPYGYPAPTRFLWDRYNIALDTHFYSHGAMLERMGSPKRRFGMLVESESIVPEDYRIFDENKGLEKDFDAVFTYSARILDNIDNARFFPACASPWYGTTFGGGTLDESLCERKTKNVSMISSAKSLCPLHQFRVDTARRLCREGLADTFGTFNGGPAMAQIDHCFAPYRYVVVVENDLSPYYFTEKVTNCFAAMCIPIYLGASRIGDFFNENGIIRLSQGDDIKKVLARCGERDYLDRIDAVRDNYRRVLKYVNIWDWLYERYFAPGSGGLSQKEVGV